MNSSHDEAGLVAGQDQYRPVLALGGILLERDPCPHDLARIGVAVGIGGVAEGGQPQGGEVVDAGPL